MENIDIKFFDIEELGIWPIPIGIEINEGEQKLSQHLERERDTNIVKIAKELFKISHNGQIFCEACTFDFSKKYGQIGEGFIEAHHIKPISKMQSGDVTRVEDFKMVCSNCHRMLHIGNGNEWISFEELKLLLKK